MHINRTKDGDIIVRGLIGRRILFMPNSIDGYFYGVESMLFERLVWIKLKYTIKSKMGGYGNLS